jgi:hypothetical protein
MLVLVEDDEMGQRDRFVVLPFLGNWKVVVFSRQTNVLCLYRRPPLIYYLAKIIDERFLLSCPRELLKRLLG